MTMMKDFPLIKIKWFILFCRVQRNRSFYAAKENWTDENTPEVVSVKSRKRYPALYIANSEMGRET